MERVYSYAVYLAESAAGDQRSQIGNEAPAGPRMFSVASCVLTIAGIIMCC